MQYVLGVDIGTGSVKAVSVDLAGNAFEEDQQYYSFNSPKSGYHEQDPELIWNAFVLGVKNIIHKTGEWPLTVGFSSAMHSLIAVDENGNALAPMITWADNRSMLVAMRLRDSAEGLNIYRDTGTPLHAMSPLCKLIWLKENDTLLFNKAHKFISIKEYIWYKLFKEFKVDHSIASATGLFDINKLTWYKDSLDLAGISAESLSQPVPTNYTALYGSMTSEVDPGFFKQGTPITIGASDGCLANLGSMANKPGIASITIGTSGAVRVASSKPLPNETAMTFSYILDEETYICGGPTNNGGLAMQWWLKNWAGAEATEADYEVMFNEIAKIPAGSEGLIFLPYLTGERAPIWDSESCGTFFGLGLKHGRAHFSRAVLEGICFALKDVLDAVVENTEPLKQINVSGGFVQSAVWVQALADITGKNLAIVQTGDASAVGAALMAMKTAGLINVYPAHANPKVFKPNPNNAGIYAKNFTAYKKLYANLKTLMHEVHQMSE